MSHVSSPIVPESSDLPCVGIDVSSARLDVYIDLLNESLAVGKDPAGIAALAARLRQRPVKLIVLEATGPYSRAVAAGLLAEGLPVSVVNPRQVRDFARSRIRNFAQRLKSAGKAAKLVIIASMRKLLTILNVMVKNGETWNAQKTPAIA